MQSKVPISRPKLGHGNDSLGGHDVGADVQDREADKGELGQVDFDVERLLPDGVDSVPRDHFGFVLAAITRNSQNLKIREINILK